MIASWSCRRSRVSAPGVGRSGVSITSFAGSAGRGFVWSGDELDAGGQGRADVEAACALAIVPVLAIPVWSVTRAHRRAATAASFAAAHVLLAVDDAIWATGAAAQISATRALGGHAQPLPKSEVVWRYALGDSSAGG